MRHQTIVGCPDKLADPTIQLVDENGITLDSNDNWKESPDRAEIQSTNIAPRNQKEAAVIFDVTPAPYTVIVRGQDRSTGVGLVEIYNVPRKTPVP